MVHAVEMDDKTLVRRAACGSRGRAAYTLEKCFPLPRPTMLPSSLRAMASTLAIYIALSHKFPEICILGDNAGAIAAAISECPDDHVSYQREQTQLLKAVKDMKTHQRTNFAFRWVPRGCNAAADECCNAALDNRQTMAVQNLDVVDVVNVANLSFNEAVQQIRKTKYTTWTSLPARAIPIWTLVFAACCQDALNPPNTASDCEKESYFIMATCAPIFFLRRNTRNPVHELCQRLTRLVSSRADRVRLFTQFFKDAAAMSVSVSQSQDVTTNVVTQTEEIITTTHPDGSSVSVAKRTHNLRSQNDDDDQTPPPDIEISVDRSAKKAESLIRKGCGRKALECFARTGVAPFSAENSAEIERKLNPHAQTITDLSADAPAVSHARRARVIAAVKACGRMKAKGITGWTRELMLPCLFNPMCGVFVDTHITRICRDELDSSLRTLHSTGILIPFVKPNGKIRPVAVGDFWIKVSWRLMLQHSRRRIRELIPQEQAVARFDGIRSTVKDVQVALDRNLAVFIGDCSGAFNNISRQAIFDFIKENCPELVGLFRFEYTNNTAVWFNGAAAMQEYSIHCGETQGSVPSSLFFAAVTAPLVRKHAAYLRCATDDVAIFCEPDKLSTLVAEINSQFAAINLPFIGEKSKIVCSQQHFGYFDATKISVSQSTIFLGGYIAADSVKAKPTDFERLSEAELLLHKVLHRLRPQYALNLIRLTSRRWHHAFACSRPALMEEVAAAVSVTNSDYAAWVLKKPDLTDAQRMQLYAPLAVGGFGIAHWKLTHRAAFENNPKEAMQVFDKLLTDAWRRTETGRNTSVKRDILIAYHEQSSHQNQPFWLSHFPHDARDELSDQEFMFAARMLLNIPMSIAAICRDEPADVDHALTCSTCSKSFHLTRHNLTASGMVRVLNMHGLYATTNLKSHFPKVLSRAVEGPDVLVILPSGGIYVLDITVVTGSAR